MKHYVFFLELSDETDAIAATATLVVEFLEDGISEIVFDLVGGTEGAGTGMTVSSVLSGDRPMTFDHVDNRLEVDLAERSTRGRTRRITISYAGRPADGLLISDNKFGDRTFFGDNWPDRARHWLPSIDHPYDKATCEFVVTAPDRYQVVANGRKVEESSLPGGRCLTHWSEAVPITTYCMVIGAARFAVHHVEVLDGIPIETWVYPQDRDAGFFDFAPAPRVVEFFSAQVGAFPYEKLANVQSRTRYGGTENASAIFYNERSVTGRGERADLVTHEIAHQWFGDSVTEADWHHIWLSEGFATYFTHLFNEFTHGRDRLEAGLARDRERVLAFHERRPDSPVVDPTIARLDDLLSANSYQKGSWVLHMLRREVGDEAFWKGIRAYYDEFRDRNAMTADFERAMEEASGKELGWFFEQWIFEAGHPLLEGGWSHAEGTLRVELRQAQPGGTVFVFPLDIGIAATGEEAPLVETVQVDERSEIFIFAIESKPESLLLDPRTWLLMDGTLEALAPATLDGALAPATLDGARCRGVRARHSPPCASRACRDGLPIARSRPRSRRPAPVTRFSRICRGTDRAPTATQWRCSAPTRLSWPSRSSRGGACRGHRR